MITKPYAHGYYVHGVTSLPPMGVTLIFLGQNGKDTAHSNCLLDHNPRWIPVLSSIENLVFKMIPTLNSPLVFSDLLPTSTSF